MREVNAVGAAELMLVQAPELIQLAGDLLVTLRICSTRLRKGLTPRHHGCHGLLFFVGGDPTGTVDGSGGPNHLSRRFLAEDTGAIALSVFRSCRGCQKVTANQR